MINFQSLQLKVNPTYSFVGIERSSGTSYLVLPRGFSSEDVSLSSFDSKKSLFFQFYNILRRFKGVCLEKEQLNTPSEMIVSDRDGVIDNDSGSQLKPKETDHIIFYSKLDIIETFLDAYDEPRILALKHRLGKSQKFSISQIHKYLHQAIYLPNHAAYFDEALLAKPVVQLVSTDIVSMYCYLYCEIKEQLGEMTNSEIRALAEDFRQHHIGVLDSIFDEDTYQRVLETLKELLEVIDKITPIKDDDYWQYYETIELFLYGDWEELKDGRIWGISNFHSVWESMCLTHLVKQHTPKSLLYVDTQYVKSEILAASGFSSTEIHQYGQLFQVNSSRLVPDAVILKSVESQIEENDFQRSYRIFSNAGWNDFGFNSVFRVDNNRFDNYDWVSIGYVGQEPGIHTIGAIQAIYPEFTGLVDRPLNSKFYSFWHIKDGDIIDAVYLHKMYCFNHLFYIALKENATDWDSFGEKFLTPLSVKFGLRHNSSQANVFTHSLLRSYCVGSSSDSLRASFEYAIRKMSGVYNDFLSVVDIKYLTESYFLGSENIEEIKNRSVRKQFVYEYLLQKHLARIGESNKTIESSFWLPKSQNSEGGLIEPGSDFMDGYIQLKSIDFMTLANSYLSS
jgi:hypothetical protein